MKKKQIKLMVKDKNLLKEISKEVLMEIMEIIKIWEIIIIILEIIITLEINIIIIFL